MLGRLSAITDEAVSATSSTGNHCQRVRIKFSPS
jgi:hypothetical protein